MFDRRQGSPPEAGLPADGKRTTSAEFVELREKIAD
mgnify:CR=1 FL=1